VQVDFASYAQRAVALVNHDVADADGVRDLVGHEWASQVRADDVPVLRKVRHGLAEVVDLAATGRDAEAVHRLNDLLAAHPVQPRISGHDASDWHLHVRGAAAALADEYAAGAIWGLAVGLCTWGSHRFGRCADAACGNAFLDTSTNRSRRYCSQRCATRAHVAAHRARAKGNGAEENPARDPAKKPGKNAEKR
jgi:predicted RNA-binding Zn ribbon-like protein